MSEDENEKAVRDTATISAEHYAELLQQREENEKADRKVVSIGGAVARKLAQRIGKAHAAMGEAQASAETLAEAVILAQEHERGRPLTSLEIREAAAFQYAVADLFELTARKRAAPVLEVYATRRELVTALAGLQHHRDALREAGAAIVAGDEASRTPYREAVNKAFDFLEDLDLEVDEGPVGTVGTVTMGNDFFVALCKKAQAAPPVCQRNEDGMVTFSSADFEKLYETVGADAFRELAGDDAPDTEVGKSFADRVFAAAIDGPRGLVD